MVVVVMVVSMGELGMEVSWVLVMGMGVVRRCGGRVIASNAFQLVVGEQPCLHSRGRRRGGRRQARGASSFFQNRFRGRAAAAASVVVIITGGGRSCIIGHVQFIMVVEEMVIYIIQAAVVSPISNPRSSSSYGPSHRTPRVEILA